jgi:hypothetical protein
MDVKNNLFKQNSNHIKSKSHYDLLNAKNNSCSPEKFNLKAIAAEIQIANGKNEDLIEKMILNSRTKVHHKKVMSSKEAKKPKESTRVKIINKYSSTHSLLKDPDFSKQSFSGQGRTSPFYN